MQNWATLPGFRTFNDFFNQLIGKGFVARVLETSQKVWYVDGILQIHGVPERPTQDLIGDWHERAVIREFREYDEFNYVRACVMSLGDSGEWGHPVNLMMLFTKGSNPILLSYTFISGNWQTDDGIIAHLWVVEQRGYSLNATVNMLHTMDEIMPHDAPVPMNSGIKLSVMNAKRSSECIHIIPCGFGKYIFDWFSHDYPYVFVHDNWGVGHSVQEAKYFICTFHELGLVGVQDLYEWRHKDADKILSQYQSCPAEARNRIRVQRK